MFFFRSLSLCFAAMGSAGAARAGEVRWVVEGEGGFDTHTKSQRYIGTSLFFLVYFIIAL